MKLWTTSKAKEALPAAPAYPGVLQALDGSAAVVAMETAGSEAAGAYPITPSTQMGEGWAVAVAEGKRIVNGRRLLFFEPEGEHAAAAVTAGMSMAGLRATNFSRKTPASLKLLAARRLTVSTVSAKSSISAGVYR